MERKKFVLLSLLVLLPLSSVMATVYQSVDENGHTVFSDHPSSHSKTVDLPPVQTYSSPELADQTINTDTTEQVNHNTNKTSGSYTSLLLSGVENNTTLNYSEPINVMVTSIPPLKQRDRYLLLIDGQSTGEPQTNGQFKIPSELARGLHTVKAVIINADHNIVKESNTLQFTIFQRSKLLGPNNVNNSNNTN